MQKNAYTAKHSSTKLTKFLLVVIWLSIIAVLCAMGWLFCNKAIQLDGTADATQSSEASAINETALVVVYDDTYSQTEPGFILLNFNGDTGAISVASLPINLISKVNDKEGGLAEQFEYGGVRQAVLAVENLCDIKIDKYCAIECELLESVSDILGSVELVFGEYLYTKSDDGAILCDWRITPFRKMSPRRF